MTPPPRPVIKTRKTLWPVASIALSAVALALALVAHLSSGPDTPVYAALVLTLLSVVAGAYSLHVYRRSVPRAGIWAVVRLCVAVLGTVAVVVLLLSRQAQRGPELASSRAGDHLGEPTAEPTPSPPSAAPTSTPLPAEPMPTPLPAEPTPPRPPTEAALSETWDRPADGMTMVYVPAGTFAMGSDEVDIVYALQLCDVCTPDWFSSERPAHTVALDGFWIDRTEVTNDQYRRCVEAGACDAPACWGNATLNEPQQPVVCVPWPHAETYCQWAGARLPTEAEWEYAARGPERLAFPWGNAFDGTRLNYCDANCESGDADAGVDDGYAVTAPVGSYPTGASWCGALDMAGNAHEWVADWHAPDYYQHSPRENPSGPADGTYKVLRGGSWGAVSSCTRGAHRGWPYPDLIAPTVSFRCAGY